MADPKLHPAVERLVYVWLAEHQGLLRVIHETVAQQIAPIVAEEVLCRLRIALSCPSWDQAAEDMAAVLDDARRWFHGDRLYGDEHSDDAAHVLLARLDAALSAYRLIRPSSATSAGNGISPAEIRGIQEGGDS